MKYSFHASFVIAIITSLLSSYDADIKECDHRIFEVPNLLPTDLPAIGTTGHLALLGFNWTSQLNFIATYSLDTSSGRLVNRQVASAIEGESFGLLDAVTIDVTPSTSFIAVKGFDTVESRYFTTVYTLDNSTNALTNKQKTFALFNESVTVIDWVNVNNIAYLATWGFDSTNQVPYIAIYTLDSATGRLTNKQKTLLNALETIAQTQWVVFDGTAYLAVTGFDSSVQLYYITIFTLNTVTGSLTNRRKTFLAALETTIQIDWTVVLHTGYLAVRGFDSIAQLPFIAIYTLTNSGNLENKQKTFLLQSESTKLMTWVTVNNIGFLAVMGSDFTFNTACIFLYTLNTATGGLSNRQKTLLNSFETLGGIAWVVVDGAAYLGSRGYDNKNYLFYEAVYPLITTNKSLGTRQKIFNQSFESVVDMSWARIDETAYLSIQGYDSLSKSPYEIVYTLITPAGALTNAQKTYEPQMVNISQMIWTAV